MTRLPEPYGTRIRRDTPVRFTFEGQSFSGFDGDVIASALAVNGQWMLSRSFKYHRPRGLMSMAGSEADTLVQLPSDPNVQADRHPITEGLTVTAQNVNGSLARDRDAFLDKLGRFMPVGFYYRTFMGPTRNSWLKLWEPLIRKKAGLGVLDTNAEHKDFEKANLFCDLLVVGGGLAGLTAAIEAAEAGADVILAEMEPDLGGALTYRRDGADRLADLTERADKLANLRIMTSTIVNGWYEDNWLPLIRGNKLFKTRAREVILATGCIEQPAVFRNNDLPGIILGSAAQRLMRHYAVKPGQRAVVLAANPEGYRVAQDLRDAGVELAAIVDPRDGGSGKALQGVQTIAGDITEAQGKTHVTGITVAGQRIDCDLVVVSVGSAPSWQLPCQAGAKLSYDDAIARFSLALPNGPLGTAGSINGPVAADVVINDARIASHAALARLGLPHEKIAQIADPEAELANFEPNITPHPKGKDFIDRDEDIQVKDLQNAAKEGYRELELIKRFTTVGMGPSQGRHSAVATARVVADATSRSIAETGVTTARPPFAPETLGVLSGHHHPAQRRSALHQEHLRLNADMRPVGAWWRPYFYGPKADANRLIEEEVKAVREGVGMLDVSTLGGLEVRGPDAGEFLNRIYTMAYKKQPVGRCRYCLMTNEMGTVIDDGVAYRLAEDMYYVTATTGAVARVYTDMLFWNAQWRLDVDVLNVTSAFSGFNITGPKARQVVEALDSDIDFSRDGFAYLDGRSGSVSSIPVCAMRIGFTGELSYELHCPSSYAKTLWDAILAAGEPVGLRPYGLEASRILRLEKGHILIGQDTDALTSPDELGFDWAVSKTKPFFVGKRSIEMRRNKGLSRKLVGLSFEGGDVPHESCLVLRDEVPVGHVTSVLWSPTLRKHIALAYVDGRDAEIGSPVTVKCRNGNRVQVPVEGHAFFDPDNTRQEV
ncbi:MULTISPECIES: 2Fe-2S iron-sulfur cluster-binding protein [unclassified Ruegeria]|uniref:2Fe-2S iron-sulfur cluster-binding protein n=1 Tax=unclassified Ruegeria TaxID=2625375 RepID=UPI001488BAED|nr:MULTISPECIES: 2Fe-2S iron-sulfur cluster-binding protein [unclassified Ruegeria]NOD64624.1 FAD-dependent oxidoreductase [Ruegeria sp. HKCCD6109]